MKNILKTRPIIRTYAGHKLKMVYSRPPDTESQMFWDITFMNDLFNTPHQLISDMDCINNLSTFSKSVDNRDLYFCWDENNDLFITVNPFDIISMPEDISNTAFLYSAEKNSIHPIKWTE